jgi:hypothetical protein
MPMRELAELMAYAVLAGALVLAVVITLTVGYLLWKARA